MTGTTVGHYEILEKLGEGGMGMVYKARDVLLNRVAALKFLSADSALTDDKRRRFLQEAQSASALNHPNIITVYEITQSGGRDFIAMELVQGRSLAELIGRKPLPTGKAITYAIQIADALAAAHSAGIVHRDLKPGNVMIADSGLVKVLDFGLAKLVAGPSSISDATQTLVNEGPKTEEGAIIGTVSYMSPEQAEGKPVDHRSDIFSFGALLYEMLTGRRAFHGESTVSTLAAILTAEPVSLTTEAPGLPAELVRIVSRCLRKLPERRWQSIADVRIAIEEFNQDLESGQIAADQPRSAVPRQRWMMIAAATAAAALLLFGIAAWWTRRTVPAPELWRVARLTADSGVSLFPAISQDGKLVTYVSDRAAGDTMELWVRQIEGGDPVQLTQGLGSCRDPAFSPDGSKIVVHCGAEPGGIYVVSTLGGLPKRLGEGERPQFSPDGSQVSYMSSAPSGRGAAPSIWIVPAGGGTGKELKPNKVLSDTPVWSPDGKGILYLGFGDPEDGKDDRDWYYMSVDGASVTPTGAIARLQAAELGLGRNIAVTTGGLLFAEGNLDSTNIYRMPFDAAYRKASGDPVPIIIGAGFNFSPTASRDGGRIAFAVGNNISTNIWRAPVDPVSGKVSGEPIRVTSGVDPSRSPSPSPDGKRLAYVGGSLRASEIRIRNLESGTDLRLAAAKEWSYVALSRDSSTIAFHSDQRDNSAIYTVPAAGGIPKKICAACGRPVEWSLDGARLLFDNAGPQRREIHILDVKTGQSKALLRHPEFGLTMPRLSPDGRLLSFTALRPGRARRIYLAAFTGEAIPEKEWTVLIDGSDLDRQPFWAPSGNLIYFLSDRDGSRCIWAQRVDAATRKPAGAPFAVHHMHQLRHNLIDVGDPATVGMSVAGGQMFYASFELNANIWLAERVHAVTK
ncbi:MAG: serine/threonine-protein kinase [Acidobacteria bacterium]|nr:serine/threonine-protein kinase [Acidobacteriota bacterium]